MTKAVKPAPVLVRILRLARLVIHLIRGLLLVWLVYPRRSPAERRDLMRRWSHRLLVILSISAHHSNKPAKLAARCMLVINHISWLDIFVVSSQFPASFVAKAEIRDWPIVGSLCTHAGTLYIERGKRSAAQRAKNEIAEKLSGGTPIGIFPEGTTTHGHGLGHFHAALFQPAVDVEAVLQPVALRYLDAAGQRTEAAGYVGETSFLESVWRIVSERNIIAEVGFLAPVNSTGETRRSLADKTENAIAAALGVPRHHKALEKLSYPQDE